MPPTQRPWDPERQYRVPNINPFQGSEHRVFANGIEYNLGALLPAGTTSYTVVTKYQYQNVVDSPWREGFATVRNTFTPGTSLERVRNTIAENMLALAERPNGNWNQPAAMEGRP